MVVEPMTRKKILLVIIFVGLIGIVTFILLRHRNGDNKLPWLKTVEMVNVPNFIPGNSNIIRENNIMSFTQGIYEKAEYVGLIPSRIIQTYKSSNMPENMSKALQSLIEQNRECEYHFYDDEACLKFMRDKCEPDVADAYMSLIPGAYKCDLFRVAYLWEYGGWYIDISMEAAPGGLNLQELTEREPTKNIFIVEDRHNPLNPFNRFSTYQAFIGVTAKHPAMAKIRDYITHTVLNRYVAENAVQMTGPGAFGMGLNMSYGKDPRMNLVDLDNEVPELCKLKHMLNTKSKRNVVAWNDEEPIVITKYGGWVTDRDITKSIHYSELWRLNLIYLRKVLRRDKPSTKELDAVSGLPPFVWTTWKTRFVTEKMFHCFHLWELCNPSLNFFFMDDQRSELFIQNYLGKNSASLYRKLVPGAFRADYWRLAVLYVHGGIYMDADTIPNTPSLEKWLKQYESYSEIMICPMDRTKIDVYNAFIIATPKHPVIKMALDMLEDNVKNERYPERDVSITGPGLLGEALRKVCGLSDSEEFVPYKTLKHNVILLENKSTEPIGTSGITDGTDFLFKTKYEKYDEERALMGGTDWAELFRNRQVYKQ